jgi:hypothetical protein
MDFLFSQNRLNVAISRARCLAFLVSTPHLVNVKAGSLAAMRLLANLCAFRNGAELAVNRAGAPAALLG